MSKDEVVGSQRSGLKLFIIVFFAFLLALLMGAWLIKTYIFPSPFTPVELNQREQLELNQKLQMLGYTAETGISDSEGIALEPQAYSEQHALREFSFSEKEVNALIGKNTELAEKMVIDFSSNLASARMVFPLDEDFPFLGGKTLRMNAGVTIEFANDRPQIILQGVSVWGVAVPNSWLGNLKQVDLVEQFGGDSGFWSAFADGVDFIKVEDGELQVKLKE